MLNQFEETIIDTFFLVWISHRRFTFRAVANWKAFGWVVRTIKICRLHLNLKKKNSSNEEQCEHAYRKHSYVFIRVEIKSSVKVVAHDRNGIRLCEKIEYKLITLQNSSMALYLFVYITLIYLIKFILNRVTHVHDKSFEKILQVTHKYLMTF